MFTNHKSIELNIPSVHISLSERARSGMVYRIVPGITGCRSCIGFGRLQYEFVPGTIDYSDVIDQRDIYFQPGLDTDISLVTMLGVKMAISTLINPGTKVSPEYNANFLHWNGYQDFEEKSWLMYGDIEKKLDCDVCSSSNEESEKGILKSLIKKVGITLKSNKN